MVFRRGFPCAVAGSDRSCAGSAHDAGRQTRPSQSLSPRAGLADASRRHEGSEWTQVGRGHQGARRAQRQYLGVSSLFPRQAQRRRHVRQSRRCQPADPGVQSGGQASQKLRRGTLRASARIHRRHRREHLDDRYERRGDDPRHARQERPGRHDGPDGPQDQSGRQGVDDDRHARRGRERTIHVRSADRSVRCAQWRHLRGRWPFAATSRTARAS